jgi:hypothetical protein
LNFISLSINKEIDMATWEANAANDLMLFAEGHKLHAGIGAFTAMVDNWADNLGGAANRTFQFGPYRVEVSADTGNIYSVGFDM